MTRRYENGDGTITQTSFSYWGNGDANERLKKELDALEKFNAQARAEWDSLSPEERELRTLDFENKRKAREELMAADLDIPPHILAKIQNKNL